MANYREDFANINLETGTISRNFMNHSIGGGDALGDRFGVRVFRNGEAVTLGGTCAGYFVRNTTGETVVITGGVVSGNEAYVTLPAACYAVDGSFTLAIKVTVDSEIVTLRIVDGVVDRTNTSVIVDPGDILPSIEDLLEAIETAVESIPADYSSLWTSLAPAFSTSTAYKAGQYVTYDGKFWRFTTDHAAGAWNAAHATQVNVGGDMSDLKSALADRGTVYGESLTWERKAVTATGVEASSTNVILSDYVSIENYNTVKFLGPTEIESTEIYVRMCEYSDNQGTFLKRDDLYNSTDGYMTVALDDACKYVKFLMGFPAATYKEMPVSNKAYFIADLLTNLSTYTEKQIRDNNFLTKTNTDKIKGKKVFFDVELTKNKVLTDAGNIVNYSEIGYCVSDYIDVTGITKVYVTANGNFHNGCCAFYKSDYSVKSIPLIAASGSTKTYFTNEEVDVPSDVKYMVIATTTGTASAYYIDGYKYYDWDGLKWCCVGDSLTERNGRTSMNYADYISRDTGIEIVNMGLSGSGYKRKYDTNGAFYQRISNVPTDCDVVTIFGSGNDQEYYSSAMGTATDTGTDTLGGCINTTIDNLYAIMPTVQLGIIAPTPWADYNPANTNNGMSRYTELLKTICANRSIPFLDLYHCANLRPWDSSFLPYAYSKDNGAGVHPDETGHKLFAGRIRTFLGSLIGQY